MSFAISLNGVSELLCVITGQVELENLPLKKDALKSFGLPIEVKHGIYFLEVHALSFS